MNDNIDVVRGGYADFLNGNINGVLDRMADQFEFITAGAPEVPYAGTFRTRDELAGFFQRMSEEVTMSVFEPREYFAEGDRVITLGRYEGKVNRNGAPFAADWAMAWTIKDGKVARMQELADNPALRHAYANATANA